MFVCLNCARTCTLKKKKNKRAHTHALAEFYEMVKNLAFAVSRYILKAYAGDKRTRENNIMRDVRGKWMRERDAGVEHTPSTVSFHFVSYMGCCLFKIYIYISPDSNEKKTRQRRAARICTARCLGLEN